MGQLVKFKPDVVDFLNKHVAVTFEEDNEKWSYIPMWYKHTDEPDTFEVFNFENLPEDFKEAVYQQWRAIKPR